MPNVRNESLFAYHHFYLNVRFQYEADIQPDYMGMVIEPVEHPRTRNRLGATMGACFI